MDETTPTDTIDRRRGRQGVLPAGLADNARTNLTFNKRLFWV
jgi:hypothetical protein